MMKKTALMAPLLALLGGLTTVCKAQTDSSQADASRCNEKLSLYYEFMRSGNMTKASSPWQYAFEHCADRSKNLYIHGVKILKSLIAKTQDAAQKKKYEQELMKVFDQRLRYFPEGKAFVLTQKASYMKDFQMASPEAIQAVFQQAFSEGYHQKVGAKPMLNYFYNATAIFNSNKNFQDYLNDHHVISEVVDYNINVYSEEVGNLIEVQDSIGLNPSQEQNLRIVQAQRKNFNAVKRAIEQMIGQVATCKQLVPMLTKSFNAHKADEKWLQTNAALLAEKDCESAAVFSKIVVAFYRLNPSAPAARGLAARAYKAGKYAEAVKYFEEAAKLEANKFKKAADYNKIAMVRFKQRDYPMARRYALQAARLRPGWGSPYLLIAALYAKSANRCGTDEFSKRAVYWVAADAAQKAARLDPSVAAKARKAVKSYLAAAPSKSMAFQKGYRADNSYKVRCWIQTNTQVR